MNKTEKKYLENLETKLALRFTAEAVSDVSPYLNEPLFCWVIRGDEVHKATLMGDLYWDGWIAAPEARYKAKARGIEGFSTQMRALLALRNKAELDAALRLRDIDRRIEELDHQDTLSRLSAPAGIQVPGDAPV